MAAVRERAVLAVLSERTLGVAAKTAGVAERTLRRWLTDDEAFKANLAEARRTAFEERAAIMEFDGRLTREDAERAAWALVAARYRLH